MAEGACAAGMPADRVMHEADATRAGAALKALAQAGDVVLVKASRGMKMERAIDILTGAGGASAKIGQGRGR
jgi:UDP-N-acetylmuramoyl-tripeptide--D-alanyl-D-alanine ligase